VRIFILTLFPAAVEAYLAAGILGIARRKRLIDVTLVNFRQYGRGRHKAVDDRPFGGGAGMVLRPEPVFECVEAIERDHGVCRRILLCPGGTTFRQDGAAALALEERLLFLCGRYEGFDERIREGLEWTEISLGDFVLCGGELPALAVIEAAARLLPGVLGDDASPKEESFSRWGERPEEEGRSHEEGNGSSPLSPTPTQPPQPAHGSIDDRHDATGLEYPQYTRPREYRGMSVPPVLLSGDHQAIRAWRRERALARTERLRPDLLRRPAARAERPGSASESTTDT
jgi:tRNA (guanine37-N1)-methyltransferase